MQAIISPIVDKCMHRNSTVILFTGRCSVLLIYSFLLCVRFYTLGFMMACTEWVRCHCAPCSLYYGTYSDEPSLPEVKFKYEKCVPINMLIIHVGCWGLLVDSVFMSNYAAANKSDSCFISKVVLEWCTNCTCSWYYRCRCWWSQYQMSTVRIEVKAKAWWRWGQRE